MKPSTRIKLGMRAALRRRYGYAALRVLRQAVRAALQDLRRWRLDPTDTRVLDGAKEQEDIRTLYVQAIRRLLRRWPDLSFSDERAQL